MSYFGLPAMHPDPLLRLWMALPVYKLLYYLQAAQHNFYAIWLFLASLLRYFGLKIANWGYWSYGMFLEE